MSLFFKRPLFILGLPRSGTSLVAGMLKKMGFWCGSTVAGDGNNPKGYFEHSHIRETVIKKQLRDLGCDPLGVSKLPELESLPIDGGLRKTIFTLVKRDGYRDQRPWFYKDAKLSLLWPMYTAAFPEASWLFVQRDVESFVSSCLRTRFMAQHSGDPDFWRQFADEYAGRIEKLEGAVDSFHRVYTPDLFAGDFSGFRGLLVSRDQNAW